MNIAPLFVLMNAQSPEERSTIGQVLMMSYLPSLTRAQSQTLAALSAQQKVAELKRQMGRSYQRGRREAELSAQQRVADLERQVAELESQLDQQYRQGGRALENEIVQEMRKSLLNLTWEKDETTGLGRIQKEIVRYLETHAEEIKAAWLKNVENLASVSEDRSEVILELIDNVTHDLTSISQVSRRPPTAEPGRMDIDTERQVLEEAIQLQEIMRKKQKNHKLSPEELDSLPNLRQRLELHQLKNKIHGFET